MSFLTGTALKTGPHTENPQRFPQGSISYVGKENYYDRGVEMTGKQTESRNPLSDRIDTLTTMQMLKVINDEDKKVAYAVEKELGNISLAVDGVYQRLASGGRLFYIGAGTSGRIGILDASECTPTFNTPPSLVQGLIAGGQKAVFIGVEGAEDDEDACRKELEERGFSKGDAIVGIAASGSTPYVLGGLSYARKIGAFTVSLSCNPGSEISKIAEVAISPVVGAEIITGSTRMKSGTAEKMVLNMISTCVMVKLGKVYGNLMVDMQVSNKKLAGRACRIVSYSTGCSEDDAKAILKESGGEVKTAIVMIKKKTSKEGARQLLDMNGGIVAKALGV